MSFHDVRFPTGVALGARGGPERLTDVVALASGHEERNQRWAHARRRYNAGYGVKSRADMQMILAFFEERRGRFHSFRWKDTLDFSSNGGHGTPTAFDQEIGTGDGAETKFQLVKRYGGLFDPYDRPITKPVAGTVRVAVAGLELAAPGFVAELATGVITFAIPPGAGEIVTAGFEFDVPVRFDTDRLDVELNHFDAAEAPHIPLIEVRE